MIQLFKNIENYKNLSLKDLAVVAKNYVYFVPRYKAKEYSEKAIPLVFEAHKLVREYFSEFEKERNELCSIIDEYFDGKYFETQKKNLAANMFDVNYALKDYLMQMNHAQLKDFGLALMFGHMRSDMFMTEENYLTFHWDLSMETNTVMEGGSFNHLEKVSNEKLVEIYLKHIDMNIILADNIAESILNGMTLQKGCEYIARTEDLKYSCLYKATILI